jgi:hypothetical protein
MVTRTRINRTVVVAGLVALLALAAWQLTGGGNAIAAESPQAPGQGSSTLLTVIGEATRGYTSITRQQERHLALTEAIDDAQATAEAAAAHLELEIVRTIAIRPADTDPDRGDIVGDPAQITVRIEAVYELGLAAAAPPTIAPLKATAPQAADPTPTSTPQSLPRVGASGICLWDDGLRSAALDALRIGIYQCDEVTQADIDRIANQLPS